MIVQQFFGASSDQDESEWITVSDLMAGLMVIFLFIAIIYIRPQIEQKDQAIRDKEALAEIQDTIREIVVAWNESELNIYEALRDEFSADLERWNAELVRDTLTIRFKAPNILFDLNSAELKPEFKAILSDFFPRYLSVLKRFASSIEEIRIEGHTSSEWSTHTSPEQAYFNNMKLSQERTRAVLEYAVMLPGVDQYREWSIERVTANGLSSSKLIFGPDGREDPEASRRVEFRVKTNSKEQIVKVVETIR